MNIEKLQEDIKILKFQNEKLQEDLSHEKDERIKITALLCHICNVLEENGFSLEKKDDEKIEDKTLSPKPVNKKEEIMSSLVEGIDELSDNEDFDEELNEQLPLLSLDLGQEENELRYTQLPETLVDEDVDINHTNEMSEIELEATLVDDIEKEMSELVIDTNLPPLPSNISKSPMSPPSENEEEMVEENINYSKMKVSELKKLCKEKGVKGYSKLKKKQLIEELQK